MIGIPGLSPSAVSYCRWGGIVMWCMWAENELSKVYFPSGKRGGGHAPRPSPKLTNFTLPLKVWVTCSTCTSPFPWALFHRNRTFTVPVEFHHDYAHTQTVETKLFSPPSLGPGNEARQESNLRLTAYKLAAPNNAQLQYVAAHISLSLRMSF